MQNNSTSLKRLLIKLTLPGKSGEWEALDKINLIISKLRRLSNPFVCLLIYSRRKLRAQDGGRFSALSVYSGVKSNLGRNDLFSKRLTRN
jgi:hypothetical protein